jgi:hypothetical protein
MAAVRRHEMTKRSESDAEARLGHARTFAKPFLGFGQSDLEQPSMRWLSFEFVEDAGEVIHAHAGVASHL